MAPSSTCTLQRAGRLRLCVILTLLLAFFSFNSALADSDNVDAAQTANSTSTAGNSHHKALVPVQGTDIGLFIVVAVALFIASGAGVGGGVLVVPSLLVISQFNAIGAVALSNITILASSVANLGFNISRRNVLRPGPLIDWELVLLFGPPIVVGSIAGSYINMVTPSWVTKVCLFVLLIPMAWRMVDKARSLYKRETAAKRAAKAAVAVKSFDADELTSAATNILEVPSKPGQLQAPTTVAVSSPSDSRRESTAESPTSQHSDGMQQEQQVAATQGDLETGMHTKTALGGAAFAAKPLVSIPTTPHHTGDGPGKASTSCWQPPPSSEEYACSDPAACQAVRDRLAKEQASMLPPFQVGLLVFLLADVAAASLLAGYLLTCGSWQYWLLVLSPLLVMLLVWAVARHYVLWKAAWKALLQMVDAADLNWDTHTTTIYPAICISAGVIAGMLGLGGGLVLAPLMLELGVDPAVSAASTQVTLLVSSSTSAIVYAVNGAVPWDYGVGLIVIGFLATLSGQWLVSWLVRRLGRPSILVITLAIMFSAATFAAAAVVVITAIDLAQHPEKLVARKGVCPA